jgi:hypothetical protein
VNVVEEIERENVSLISSPLRPKGRNGLVTAPWSGAPNQSMVGGPPLHSAIKSGWGPRLAGGTLRHRRRRVPPPGSGAPGATARRSTASFEIPSFPSRHCNLYVKPPPPLRPRRKRWHSTPRSRQTPMVCAPSFSLCFL